MDKIVLASSNAKKIEEFKQIFSDKEVLSLKDINYNEDIEETGTTFLENALIKAKTISKFLKNLGISCPVISDDSGLCVNSLGGAPGIYSARYSGGHGNNEENRAKLLRELKDKNDRSAYFECVVAEYYPDDTYIYGEGKTFGSISFEEKGDKSFGYDCLFYSNDLKKIFGECTHDEKNAVSHRFRAIQDLLKKEKERHNN
jgi:XTP/dITP diphosphohydrolase